MDVHLDQKITLSVVAEYCGVSVSTITQLFQKKMDMTFHHFVTRLRLEKAKELILTGVPLEQTGRQVGYQDHSTFYRAFRQYFGVSPREYRNRLLEEATFPPSR